MQLAEGINYRRCPAFFCTSAYHLSRCLTKSVRPKRRWIKPTKMYMGSSGERETVTYTNGEFFVPNLSPGLYAMNGIFSGDKFFALGKNLRQNTFLIEAGRVVYAGSYKLKLEKGGLFRRDKGSFVRIGSLDTERQLLEWLAKELTATGWASEINARLSERRRRVMQLNCTARKRVADPPPLRGAA